MPRYLLRLDHREVALPVGRLRLGRGPTCEVRIDDERVSRHHATLDVRDDGVRIADQGSRNGVLVNGQRIYGSVELRSGDVIDLGVEQLTLVNADAEAHDPAVVPTAPIQRLADAEASDPLASLSPRERQVLELTALGHSAREVAEQIGVSVKTVETYRSRIADKLDLPTRADLVRFALDHGVLR